MIIEEPVRLLLDWFYKYREPHFFRKNRTPYKVWVSEVALQQTRIPAAINIVKRFLKKFPDIYTLAEASEESVLIAFRGLGYYNRARNLRKGAIIIVNKYKGEFPKSFRELVEVPSIGPYTAAAIASICFGEKVPVLDGNVKRILSRLLTLEYTIGSKEFDKTCFDFLLPIFSSTLLSPGDINEALMELGQKICLKTKTLCHICALRNICIAYQKNRIKEFPKISPRPKPRNILWYLYIFKNLQGKVLMQKWTDFYFLKGHWSFPSILHFEDENSKLLSFQESISEKLNLSSPREEDFFIKHTITTHKIKIYPIIQKIPEVRLTDSFKKDNFTWLDINNVKEKLVSSALMKCWEKTIEKFLQNENLISS